MSTAGVLRGFHERSELKVWGALTVGWRFIKVQILRRSSCSRVKRSKSVTSERAILSAHKSRVPGRLDCG